MSDEHINTALREERLRRNEPNNCHNNILFDAPLYIRELQTCLRLLEPDESRRLIPDGVFGPETAEAVKRFQEDAGMAITGEVDRSTWDAIISEARRRS